MARLRRDRRIRNDDVFQFRPLCSVIMTYFLCNVYSFVSFRPKSPTVLVVSQLNSSHAVASDWGDSSDADGENRRVVGDRTRGSG